MRRFILTLCALGLTLALPHAAAGDRDRFPGFVYTSPEAIKDAQDALVALKYLKAEEYKEGEWDAKSREATRDFQRDHFLRPDGRLDRDTMALLMSHKPRTKEKKD
jgi:putative peptidoglycan binding protein